MWDRDIAAPQGKITNSIGEARDHVGARVLRLNYTQFSTAGDCRAQMPTGPELSCTAAFLVFELRQLVLMDLRELPLLKADTALIQFLFLCRTSKHKHSLRIESLFHFRFFGVVCWIYRQLAGAISF